MTSTGRSHMEQEGRPQHEPSARTFRRSPEPAAAALQPEIQRAARGAGSDVAASLRRRARSSPGNLLALQQTAGNRAVQRMVAREAGSPPARLAHPVQAKLTVGPADDVYEREADRIAHEVVQRWHDPAPVTQPGSNISEGPAPAVQRQADALGGLEVSPHIAAAIERARGGGQPLSSDVRGPMENALGADLSGVRVHAGTEADRLSRSIQARAFTTGRDIFFAQGALSTAGRQGQELIAHELVHVVQQSGGGPQGVVRRARLDDFGPPLRSTLESRDFLAWAAWRFRGEHHYFRWFERASLRAVNTLLTRDYIDYRESRSRSSRPAPPSDQVDHLAARVGSVLARAEASCSRQLVAATVDRLAAMFSSQSPEGVAQSPVMMPAGTAQAWYPQGQYQFTTGYGLAQDLGGDLFQIASDIRRIVQQGFAPRDLAQWVCNALSATKNVAAAMALRSSLAAVASPLSGAAGGALGIAYGVRRGRDAGRQAVAYHAASQIEDASIREALQHRLARRGRRSATAAIAGFIAAVAAALAIAATGGLAAPLLVAAASAAGLALLAERVFRWLKRDRGRARRELAEAIVDYLWYLEGRDDDRALDEESFLLEACRLGEKHHETLYGDWDKAVELVFNKLKTWQ